MNAVLQNELTRTAFETSRLMEFFTASELSQQMGATEEWWQVAALKELIDNALDACENASIAPKIGIEVDATHTTVTDNAGGIPEAVIRSSLDYMVRVSDKAYYVSPTRGQLGNALKCIYAAPYVMSGEVGQVRIETRGISYDIAITLDRIAQAPALTVETGQAQTDCTKVRIEWPVSTSSNSAYGVPTEREIVQNFAMLNPHAEFTLNGEVWRPTVKEWEKWKTNNPTSPHWYTPEQLRSLIAAYVNAERKSGQPRTVRELVSEFRGLSRTAIQKKVTEDAGLHGALLSDLVKDGDITMPRVERLLSAMKEHSKPINPKLLGTIGQEHLTTRMSMDHGVEQASVKYIRKIGDCYILEVAFGVYREEAENNRRRIITGLNWSPTMDMPIREIRDTLNEMNVASNDPVCVVVHIAKPHFEFTERGKGHANV